MREEPSIAIWEDRRLVAVVITVGLVFLSGGSALVYVHQTYPVLRASIVLVKDLFLGFFTVSGILVAAETLRRSALSSRRLLALRLVEDWSTEVSRIDWRALVSEVAQSDSVRMHEIWNSDPTVRQELVGVLNSCERIAQAVREGSADERTLRERLGLMMTRYFSDLKPLVLFLRWLYSNPHLFEESERLLGDWERMR